MKTVLRLTVITFSLVLLHTLTASASAQVVGKWKTIDDETNKPKSIVEIYEKDGKYFGKIVKLFLKEGDNPTPTCDKCPADDPRKDQPTLGMEIIKDLKKEDGKYAAGKILDPKKGKEYTCAIWPEGDDKLKVKGSFLFISRTQTWLKVEE